MNHHATITIDTIRDGEFFFWLFFNLSQFEHALIVHPILHR